MIEMMDITGHDMGQAVLRNLHDGSNSKTLHPHLLNANRAALKFNSKAAAGHLFDYLCNRTSTKMDPNDDYVKLALLAGMCMVGGIERLRPFIEGSRNLTNKTSNL